MYRFIFIILFFFPLLNYAVCKKKWYKTASGIYYKVYTNDTTKLKPVFGDHIWMHLRKYSIKKNEIFNTRIFDKDKGVEMEYKKPIKSGDVTEIFSLLGKGDSAMVMIRSNLIDSNGSKRKYYTFMINLIDFKPRELYIKEKNEQFDKQRKIDSFAIMDYINYNDLHQCVRDEYGIWYLTKQHGTEKSIHPNDSVTIHYKGKLLNGNEFDNSYDRKQVFKFVVGKKQVIEGLDKGIQHFYVGDKCMLLIPSSLGYGDKEVGKIPPNSVLIFDMEIIE